jgi:hypothetical protein
MNYSQAIAQVNNGKYAWRLDWTGKWIWLQNGQVWVTDSGPGGEPYHPTPDDVAATNWDSGDHPPHK